MSEFPITAIFLSALGLLRKHLLSLMLLALAALSPYLLVTSSAIITGVSSPPTSASFHLLNMLLSELLVASVVFIGLRSLNQRRLRWSTGFRRIASRMPVIIAVGMVSSIGVTAIPVAPILIIPALYITCILYMAIPVAIHEDYNTLDSLRRAAQLSAGHRMHILALLLLILSVVLVASSLASKLIGPTPETPNILYWALVYIAQALVSVYAALVSVCTYAHLRERPTF